MYSRYIVNVVLLVLVVWSIPWWIYNRFIRTDKFHPIGDVKFPTPKWMSCAIPYVSTNPKKNFCENVKFDGWSLGHIGIYFTLGLLVPGLWKEVLGISLGCELFEYVVGWRARWIIDPVANCFGYLLGHIYYINLDNFKWLSNKYTTFGLAIFMILILYLNRPAMMNGEFI